MTSGLDAQGPGAAVGELAEAYLRALAVERNYSEHTIRSYGTDLRAYLRWCERGGVDAMNPNRRALRAYLGYLNAAGYARTTVNRHLSAIRGFYGWLVITGRLDADPTTIVQGMKKGRRLPHKIAPAEMAAILAVHGPNVVGGAPRVQSVRDLRDQAVLELLYASGCRISEAAGLTFGGLDLQAGQVRLFGKGSKERIVPIHEVSLASLKAYLKDGRPALANPKSPSSLVFLSNRGNAYSPALIRRMFHETLGLAGVGNAYTPHDMRHTFASDMLEGGANLRSVQELLGHASPSTTQVYTHLSPSYLKQVHGQAHPRG